MLSSVVDIFYHQPTFTSDLRHSLRLGLVLIFLLVLMTTHVGTGLFCLVRFISLFLREVFFRAAMCDFRINFLPFLSVSVPALAGAKIALVYAAINQINIFAKAY